MAPETRIPAWKKIGLSIKSEVRVGNFPETPFTSNAYGKNTPQRIDGVGEGHLKPPQSSGNITASGENKEPSHSETTQEVINSQNLTSETQKNKTSKSSRLKAEGHVNRLSAKSINSTTSPLALDPLISKKRKSVNFTPDTKENDGDELCWVTEEAPKIDLNTSPKAKKQKRTTSSKSTLTQNSRSKASPAITLISDSRTQSILTYLDNFHKSKVLGDTNIPWKFNKAKEKGVVRYCLEVDKDPVIPERYDEALHAYLKGLQSSFYRTYLRKMASQVRQHDEEDLEKQYSQNVVDSYKKAVDRHKKRLKNQLIETEEHDLRQDPLWKFRLLKRERAEMILSTLRETETETSTNAVGQPSLSTNGKIAPDTKDQQLDTNENAQTRVIQTTEVGGKRKRKRKRRTGVPDDDSSSSSSASSSSEDEDQRSGVLQDTEEDTNEEKTSEEETSERESSEEDSSEGESS